MGDLYYSLFLKDCRFCFWALVPFALPLGSPIQPMNVLDPALRTGTRCSNDTLAAFRSEFHLPVIDGKQTLYFTGNSLGLMPKAAEKYLEEELEDWKNWGVEGHFHARRPWMPYHEFFLKVCQNLWAPNRKKLWSWGR